MRALSEIRRANIEAELTELRDTVRDLRATLRWVIESGCCSYKLDDVPEEVRATIQRELARNA